jgi:hypothetical protein
MVEDVGDLLVMRRVMAGLLDGRRCGDEIAGFFDDI